jgi:hypothetical protein
MKALARMTCPGVAAGALAAALACALVCAVACVLAPAASAGATGTAAYAPYLVPPQPPQPQSALTRALLRDSRVTAQAGWIVAYLHGTPYQVGFQNGYLTAQSADYFIQVDLGKPGGAARRSGDLIARRVVWHKIPRQYRLELAGIAAGLHAAGYPRDTLWDVVAANDWADQDCYAGLLHAPLAATRLADGPAARARKGGCSAFIATGKATSDGRPVMGHNTWSAYDQNFMYNVMYFVRPSTGRAFSFQSAGGQIWSGQDWYANSAGLLLTETTLADTSYRRAGVPVFVRAREAAQYATSVGQAVRTLLNANNGAYCNEWLIGDRHGEIASLQMGCAVHDLHVTRSGFFGSSNYDWGKATRREEGAEADPPQPANDDYARYVRWQQLARRYAGHIDAPVAQTMEADTYDTWLRKICPDERTICGEPENGSAGVPYSGDYDGGAYDAKVCTEDMALHGLQVWARWGHPDGDPFSAEKFLRANPTWAADNGPLAVFGLQTFAAQTPNPWVLLSF